MKAVQPQKVDWNEEAWRSDRRANINTFVFIWTVFLHLLVLAVSFIVGCLAFPLHPWVYALTTTGLCYFMATPAYLAAWADRLETNTAEAYITTGLVVGIITSILLVVEAHVFTMDPFWAAIYAVAIPSFVFALIWAIKEERSNSK